MDRRTVRQTIHGHVKYHKDKAVKAKEAIKTDVKALTLLRVLEMVVVLVVALQLTILLINFFRPSQPILGLKLEGETIGISLNEDAKKAVGAIVADRQNKVLSIEVAEVKSTITLSQLGEKANIDQAYAKVIGIGRTGSIFNRIVEQNQALIGQNNVTLNHPGFDMALAQDYVATLNKQIDIKPTNAAFVRKDNTVIVQPEKSGRAIDSDVAIKAIRAADLTKEGPVVLPTISVDAPVTSALLSPLLSRVQRVVGEPLTLTAAGSTVTLSPDQLVAAVVPKIVQTDGRPPVVEITYSVQQLNAAIDSVVQAATVQPRATLMSGSIVIRLGTKGLQVKDDQSIIRVLTALIERQTGVGNPTTVTIPMISVDPQVVQQGPSPGNTTGTGAVRLTFDDGPCAHTGQVLSILRQYNVKATFYLVGRNVNSCPAQVADMVAAGHRVGNHSYTHSDLTTLSYSGVVNEIVNTQNAIRNASGVAPVNFRPPYGAINSTVRQVAGAQGVSVDLWSVDPQDWAQPGSGVIAGRVLSNARPGSVILMHVLYQQSVDALPSIITGLRARGLTIE